MILELKRKKNTNSKPLRQITTNIQIQMNHQLIPQILFLLYPFHRYTVVGKALIYYIIPLVVIGALYLLMAHRLRKSAREITSEIAGPQSRNQARARRYVARMVVAFVVGKYLHLFILCMVFVISILLCHKFPCYTDRILLDVLDFFQHIHVIYRHNLQYLRNNNYI